MTPTTVVGYARVSTEEQATTGVSLDAQVAKLRAYAATYDLDLVAVEVDDGVSAKSLQRPALGRALARLDAGEADGLLVAKLDRLTRSVRDVNDLVDRYFGEKAGRKLFSVGEAIDTRKASGRMVMNLMTTVAQWEREVICERTREALAHKRARGERIGSVPYGFRLDESDPRRSKTGRPVALAIEPREMEAVALAARLGEDGKSLRMIAACLQALGYPTRGGRPWRHTSVVRILGRAR